MQEWLDDNDILPYLTHSKGKSVVAERFVKRLRVESKKKKRVMIESLILGI